MIKLHRNKLVAFSLHAIFLLAGTLMQGTDLFAASSGAQQSITKEVSILNKMDAYICDNASTYGLKPKKKDKNNPFSNAYHEGEFEIDGVEDEIGDDMSYDDCMFVDGMKEQFTILKKEERLYYLLKAAFNSTSYRDKHIKTMDEYICKHASTHGLQLNNEKELRLFAYFYTEHEFDPDGVKGEFGKEGTWEDSVFVNHMKNQFTAQEKEKQLYNLLKAAYKAAYKVVVLGEKPLSSDTYGKSQVGGAEHRQHMRAKKVHNQPNDTDKRYLQEVDTFMQKNARYFNLYKLASQQNEGGGALQSLFGKGKIGTNWMDVLTVKGGQKNCCYLTDLLKECGEGNGSRENMFKLLEKAVLHVKLPKAAHGINDFLEKYMTEQSKGTIAPKSSAGDTFLWQCLKEGITTKEQLITQIGENASMKKCVFVDSFEKYWREIDNGKYHFSVNDGISRNCRFFNILQNASKLHLIDPNAIRSKGTKYLRIESGVHVMQQTRSSLACRNGDYFSEFFPDEGGFLIHADDKRSGYFVNLRTGEYNPVELLVKKEKSHYTILGGQKGTYLLLLQNDGNKIVIYNNTDLAKLSLNNCKMAYDVLTFNNLLTFNSLRFNNLNKVYTGAYLRPRLILSEDGNMIYFIEPRIMHAFNQQERTYTKTELSRPTSGLTIFKIVRFNNKSYLIAAGKEVETSYFYKHWYLITHLDEKGCLKEKKIQVKKTKSVCNKLFIESDQHGINLFLATYMLTDDAIKGSKNPSRATSYVSLEKHSIKIGGNHKIESKDDDTRDFNTQSAMAIKNLKPDQYQRSHSVQEVYSLGYGRFFISCKTAAFYVVDYYKRKIFRIKNAAPIAAGPKCKRLPHEHTFASIIDIHAALDGSMIVLYTISPHRSLVKYFVFKQKEGMV